MKNMQQQVVLHEQTIKEEEKEEEEEEEQHQGGRRDLDDEKEDGFVKIEESNPSYNTLNDQSMNSCWEEDGVVVGDDDQDLLNVVIDHDGDDDVLMSYEDFPPLPDFPCISSSSSSTSSSSSSSSNPQHQYAAVVTCTPSSSTTTSSSASSSAPWAMMKTDHHHHHEHASMVSTHGSSMEIHHQNSQDEAEMFHRMNSSECMDVLDGLGDMDLLDTDDMWDPSSLFPYEQEQEQEEEEEIKDHQHQLVVQQDQQEKDPLLVGQRNDDEEEEEVKGDENNQSEDLAMVFLEWLKSNKESISAEDLRSIKLKRSTIECAAKRLGGGKEGMKQLVKLILEWVQNHHLQKKRDQASSLSPHQENPHLQSFQNSNPNPSSITTTPWVSSLPSYDHSLMYPPPPSMPYMHGTHDSSLFTSPPFNPTSTSLTHVNPFSPSSSTHDYNMFDSSSTSSHSPNWPSTTPPPPPPPQPPHFSISSSSSSQYMHQDSNLVPPPPPQQVPTLQRSFSNYPCPQMLQGGGTGTGSGEGSLMRLGSSATKEARKKRMARQRKLFFHHNRSSSSSSTHNQQTRLAADNSCTTTTPTPPLPLPLPLPIPNQANNWVYWPSSSPSPTSVAAASLNPSPSMQNPQQQYQKQLALERRHGCKPVEKNLKFLLQKVLKQSDVGNLGRIVLPKKEAETYLPELDARDGISIAMEDIGTSRIWNMRYRFWPNNKSRMYLLENTGDFVRSNSLQEGDFIVIYLDVKCGKYLIRGVKVRQPGSKCEVKKLTKAHKNLHHPNSSVFDPSSSSFKQTVT